MVKCLMLLQKVVSCMVNYDQSVVKGNKSCSKGLHQKSYPKIGKFGNKKISHI